MLLSTLHWDSQHDPRTAIFVARGAAGGHSFSPGSRRDCEQLAHGPVASARFMRFAGKPGRELPKSIARIPPRAGLMKARRTPHAVRRARHVWWLQDMPTLGCAE
jgi:hypothetical protein